MSKEKEKVAEEIKEEVKEEKVEAEEGTTKEPPKRPEEPKTEVQEEQKDDANDKYLRLLADYQNMKRRVEQEKADIYAYGNEKIVKDMLDVIDNFERALEVETTDKNFKEGIELILKQFKTALEKAGVSEIEALGKEFDPNFHNAVMMEDNPDFESGHVTCVLQKGYILNSRVVRPSMVKVAN